MAIKKTSRIVTICFVIARSNHVRDLAGPGLVSDHVVIEGLFIAKGGCTTNMKERVVSITDISSV